MTTRSRPSLTATTGLTLSQGLRSVAQILRLDAVGLTRYLEEQAGENPALVLAHEALLLDNPDNWLAREILHYWKRVLKRIDVTSRSLTALVEHGSCFAGVLAEILWAVDRTYMMEGEFEGDNRPLAAITLSPG
ncbi:MAG TPA: hypothetical protein PKD10_11800, partial [Paracoccaceae bacterium]|nr:hypothetical protein [Paracoccaceae bacterium]